MKIVVLNTVLSNTGDAAIYAAILQSLEDVWPTDSKDVVAFDSAATTTARLYPEWRIHQQPTRSTARSQLTRRVLTALRTGTISLLSKNRWLRTQFIQHGRSQFAKSLRLISDADIVLSSGGTYLVDHYNFGHRVAEIEFAKACGKPVMLWTQSMGPFKTARAKNDAERVAEVVDGVFFRDARSQSAWRTVAALPSVNGIVPDVVFALRSRALTQPRRNSSVPSVALISVREWSRPVIGNEFNFKTYSAGMRKVAEDLIEAGWRCVAISTCQGVEGYSIDDSVTARKIFAGLDVEIDSAFHTPAELITKIRSADFVVATRMHMAILSLISQVPVVAIAYETKSLELFSSLNRANAVIPIENVSSNWAKRISESGGVLALGAQLSDDELLTIAGDALRPAVELKSTLKPIAS